MNFDFKDIQQMAGQLVTQMQVLSVNLNVNLDEKFKDDSEFKIKRAEFNQQLDNFKQAIENGKGN